MDGTFTGVVDRIVDGETAVILLEDDDDVIEQIDLPVDDLPAQAKEDGGLLRITLQDGELISLESAAEETRSRRESTQEKLDRLSRRLSEE
jgi:hypothetical protein